MTVIVAEQMPRCDIHGLPERDPRTDRVAVESGWRPRRLKFFQAYLSWEGLFSVSVCLLTSRERECH